MKRLMTIIMVFAFVFSFNACDLLFGTAEKDATGDTNNPTPEGTRKISKEFWGEWLRMDTGDTWYITNSSIKVNNRVLSTNVSLTKQSNRVTEVTEGSRKYYLYASRTTTSNFSGKVAGVGSGSRNTGRAAGAGLGGISVVISNLNNKAETTTVTTDGGGRFIAEGVIAGDEYEIKTEGQTTVVLPNANGDDVGTITVTNGVNFKTVIKPKSATYYPYAALADMNRLYANLNAYDLNIEIENTGTVDCTAAIYSLDFDSDLIALSGASSGILGTIEPKKKKIIELTLACKAIQNEYEFKRIGITIDDPISGKSWDDSVSIKFHKAPTNFYIRSSSPVSGVIITPNANAYSFKIASGSGGVYSAALTMPWSTKDYLVVFSGATADTEAVYSLGINVIPDTNFTDFRDLANYETNNTEAEAATVNMQNKIMSYLHKNDIDYFKINLGATAPEIKPVTITAQAIKESLGNDDGNANPNETHYLDIRVRNNTNATINISSATLSTTSEYVTIDNGTASIGNLDAGYYNTLTYSYANSTASSAQLLYTYSSGLSKAFRFTITENCPVGMQLPFTVTFTDSWGNAWTDALTIPVVGTGASIAINTPVASNIAIREAANGNDDKLANPHESLYLDIRVKNAGTSNALGLQAVLSTTSGYVTIDNGTATIGNLDAGYYNTLTYSYANSTASSAQLLYTYSSGLSKAFRFTITENCPVGTQLPFTVTFTDSWGNVWTDALTIPVVGTGASIAINTPVESNFAIREAANGNDDNLANPRESLYLDIRVKNAGTSNVLGLQAVLSTTSGYVTMDNGTATIGNLDAGYYNTLTYSYASSTANSTQLLYTYSSGLSNAFKFTITENCPVGTQLPFTVTFTDSWGNVWTDSLTIPVVGTGASIAINTPVDSNFSIKATASNLNQAKPNETYYFDIRMKNSGTSNALALQAVLSTTSEYVTIVNGTATIGNLDAGYYKTLTDNSYSYSSAASASLLYTSLSTRAFSFTIAGDCPVGTQLPFTVTFTDSWGNVWTDALTIPVQ
jgi:hypothetical protein